MNPDKWKSVVIPLDSYKILKGMAVDEHRTISGQFTYLLEQWSDKDQEQDEKK